MFICTLPDRKYIIITKYKRKFNRKKLGLQKPFITEIFAGDWAV